MFARKTNKRLKLRMLGRKIKYNAANYTFARNNKVTYMFGRNVKYNATNFTFARKNQVTYVWKKCKI